MHLRKFSWIWNFLDQHTGGKGQKFGKGQKLTEICFHYTVPINSEHPISAWKNQNKMVGMAIKDLYLNWQESSHIT